MSWGGEKCCRVCLRGTKLHKITIIWSAAVVDIAIISHMNTVPHLLIVDDDKETCVLLSKFLVRHGYRVSVAHDSKTMAQVLDTARINLMILDLMLPGEDGLAICRRLRAASKLPIIMLTAMGEEMDRIVGLEMGADDYSAEGRQSSRIVGPHPRRSSARRGA
jgi:CheY-like chemotaxis protein